MEQSINLLLVPGHEDLLEQAAQPSQIGIDPQQLPPGLLILTTLHPEAPPAGAGGPGRKVAT